MNTLALFLFALAPALQEGWRDTHRVHLRNGNFVDGVVQQMTEAEILIKWSPGAVVRLKTSEVLKVEEITIRPLSQEPKKVPIPKVDKPPVETPLPETKDKPADVKSPADSDIGRLLTRLLNTPTMDWESALKQLRATGLEGAKAMIAEVHTMDPTRTNLVMAALDQIRDPKIETDLRGLLSASRADIRTSAVNILAGRATPGVLKPILALSRDPDPEVRIAVLMAAAALGDASNVDAVADMTLDHSPNVRGRAFRSAEALSARVGSDNALTARLLGLSGRASGAALADSALSLGRLAERAGDGFPAEEVRSRLRSLLSDRDAATRGAAAYGLTGVKPAEASADAVLEAFANERDPRAVAVMCDALGRLKIFKAIGPLIDRLESDSKEIRGAAQRGIEKISGSQEFGGDVEKWREWYQKNKGQSP